MIIEILINENHLTKTEKRLAYYLLDKNNDLKNITCADLEKRSYTSQSVITHLYQRLGLKTFQEFISILSLERNEYFKMKDFSFDLSYEKTQEIILDLYAQIVARTNLLVNNNIIEKVCNKIMNASSIDIYGMGISETLAKQFHFQLQSLGIHSVYQNEINLNYMKKSHSNIFIFIQLRQLNDDTIDALNELNNRSIYTLGIINNKYSHLKVFQDILSFDDNINSNLKFMCSFFAVEYILNLIFATLLYQYQKI